MNDARICQAHPGKIDNPDWHENFNTRHFSKRDQFGSPVQAKYFNGR